MPPSAHTPTMAPTCPPMQAQLLGLTHLPTSSLPGLPLLSQPSRPAASVHDAHSAGYPLLCSHTCLRPPPGCPGRPFRSPHFLYYVIPSFKPWWLPQWGQVTPGWRRGAHLPAGASGAGLRQGVVGLGERLWVGDPGRLSLDDREWWRPEEKLRLVCSTEDCLEIFLKSDFRLQVRDLMLQNPLPQQPTELCHGSSTNTLGRAHPASPVLGLPPAAPLAPACHAALGHILPGGAHLDGGVL